MALRGAVASEINRRVCGRKKTIIYLKKSYIAKINFVFYLIINIYMEIFYEKKSYF